MSVAAKICGLNSETSVDAAVEGGARYIGFVFYPPSPRSVTVADVARLVDRVPREIRAVALLVDPADDDVKRVIDGARIDLIQLHGRETPDRVAAIQSLAARPVMKAIRIADAADLESAAQYETTADRLLFDAKPPADLKGALPGGNALSFDWSLLRDRTWSRPWMLSGGLNVENVTEAVGISGAKEVDVSSGVEHRPGVKDPARIKEFLRAVSHL